VEIVQVHERMVKTARIGTRRGNNHSSS